VVPVCTRGTPAKSARVNAVAQYTAEAATERLFRRKMKAWTEQGRAIRLIEGMQSPPS